MIARKGFTPTPIVIKHKVNTQLVWGFTLIELLLTVGILAFCICSLLLTYMNMFILSDLSRDLTLATNAVLAKMEELKKTNFDSLSSFNGAKFDIDGFSSVDAKGVVEVTSTAYSDLKTIRIITCFKSRGRVLGEDKNLNGILDLGEDTNDNGRLDSLVELATLIAK